MNFSSISAFEKVDKSPLISLGEHYNPTNRKKDNSFADPTFFQASENSGLKAQVIFGKTKFTPVANVTKIPNSPFDNAKDHGKSQEYKDKFTAWKKFEKWTKTDEGNKWLKEGGENWVEVLEFFKQQLEFFKQQNELKSNQTK